mmetsp:Transcript_27191/g.76705  ORF Transcript_27191/g.76705 Transcript_27191/m.76705 type:complete len:236 (-) Transcript_27191:119-826(-)
MAVASASILCCVETLWQLLADAFAGVMGTVSGLLCPRCLTTVEAVRDHSVPVEWLVPGGNSKVGSFPVDTVKQLLKGALPHEEPSSAGNKGDGQLRCRKCQAPARSMTSQLHGLTNATALLGKSVPLAASLAAIQRKVSLARVLSQRSRSSKVCVLLSHRCTSHSLPPFGCQKLSLGVYASWTKRLTLSASASLPSCPSQPPAFGLIAPLPLTFSLSRTSVVTTNQKCHQLASQE